MVMKSSIWPVRQFMFLIGLALLSMNAQALDKRDLIVCSHFVCERFDAWRAFGSWSVSQELFDYILTLIPAGSTIVELGSGWATGEFAKHYTMYSIENNEKWLNKYASNYIYAPIVNGWYDAKKVAAGLPKNYSLILIDGPMGTIGRGKFYDNLHLFNTQVPMIFDDINRSAEYELMVKVSQKLNRPYEVVSDSSGKQFGVLR